MNFSDVYDDLMDPSIYEDWMRIIQERVVAGASILDLACGTGQMSQRLAKEGFKVTGLDSSEEMLVKATKARFQRESYSLIQGDMRNLEGLPQYDLILCALDSLCYLVDFNQVLDVFYQASAHLKPGGQFFFDVHTMKKFEKDFDGYAFNYVEEDYAFIWTSFAEIGQDESSVDHELTLFYKEEDRYQRQDRLIQERTYPLASYLDGLSQAGFSSIDVMAEDGTRPVRSDSRRLFFCAKKA